jgi:ABC-type sugar transport system substrate-binding protein
VVDPVTFRIVVAPFFSTLDGRKCMVIAAVGKITPEMEKLLNDRRVRAYVSVDFYEIGHLAHWTMKPLVEGLPVPPKVNIRNAAV